MIHHPDEAKAIVQERLHASDSYIAKIWPEHRFSLSLDQPLIVAMKDQAQWLIRNNYTTGTAIPDFTTFIYADGLKALKPQAVTIIP